MFFAIDPRFALPMFLRECCGPFFYPISTAVPEPIMLVPEPNHVSPRTQKDPFFALLVGACYLIVQLFAVYFLCLRPLDDSLLIYEYGCAEMFYDNFSLFTGARSTDQRCIPH